ncbi:MAG: hypothetical protein LC114_00640 [Bryobacterales bacterium]|nr:hypothetical protein [Bryobacterales bacterium]
MTIYPTDPNFFSANANGKGVAAGQAVLVRPGSSAHVVTELANCSPGGICTNRPIDFGADGQELFLVLYGTGFPSGPEMPAVYIDGEPVPVEYCGPQGQYIGLDQVNLRVPPSFRNTGIRTIQMEYKGPRSNAVTALF